MVEVVGKLTWNPNLGMVKIQEFSDFPFRRMHFQVPYEIDMLEVTNFECES